MTRLKRLYRGLRQYAGILVGLALLPAVYLLPPDTSLAELQDKGMLTACVPVTRPPLVTEDPQAPGLEVEILKAIADDLGVGLSLSRVPAMGQDFNPRSWRITRAQCAIIGGGMVDSLQTRSFLEVSPAYGETGWVAVAPQALHDLRGRNVGVLAAVQGFDRIALSRFLRDQEARAVILRSSEELIAGLKAGRFEAAVTEALIGRRLAAEQGWEVWPLPPPLEPYPLVLGLWKGDLTLKRAVARSLEALADDGRLAEIRRRYLGAG